MLQNAYFLAKIGADTAEIELHFAEMLPIGHRRLSSRPTGATSRSAERSPRWVVTTTFGSCAHPPAAPACLFTHRRDKSVEGFWVITNIPYYHGCAVFSVYNTVLIL